MTKMVPGGITDVGGHGDIEFQLAGQVVSVRHPTQSQGEEMTHHVNGYDWVLY